MAWNKSVDESQQPPQPPAAPVVTLDQLGTLIKEIRRPSDEQQAEIDATKARKAARKADFIRERTEFERIARYKYVNCIDGSRHQKLHPYEGQHTINGQLNGDGYVHALCIKCQAEFPKFKPEHLQGNDLADIRNITPELIESWAKSDGIDTAPYRFEKAVAATA